MAEPISLYFKLEDGQSADLEVVARASLAWAAAIKELTYIAFPDGQVKIELASTTEGSLGIDTVIRGVRNISRSDLRAVAIGVLTFLSVQTATYGYEKLLDLFFDEQDPVELSDENVARIVDAINRGAARHQVEALFAEIERDPSIIAVGVTPRKGEVPRVLIPRSEFRRGAGFEPAPGAPQATRRITPIRYEARLVKPVLIEGSRRRWRFLTSDGEQSYIMRDDQFVAEVLAGRREIPLVDNLVMDLDVERTEELRDGVWNVTDQSIVRVRSFRRPSYTGLLDLGLVPYSDQDDD